MKDNNSICLPKAAETIIERLENAGFKAYAVGGCVRDALLGKPAGDWDICTSALPEETMDCFRNFRLIETGIRHGTVTIVLDHMPYEVTTFRVDGAYSDHRHPDLVRFVASLREDLSRRDFGMNAMAYHPRQGIVDYFDGIGDIRRRTVRCVGNPGERFREDALRMMRALRFASVFQFDIEGMTRESIHRHKPLLKDIAAERIQAELCKLLTGPGVGGILREFPDVLCEWIPEIQAAMHYPKRETCHGCTVWEHIVRSVESAPPSRVIRLAMLLHDLGKPDGQGSGRVDGRAVHSAQVAREIMKRLRLDNNTVHVVEELVLYHDAALIPGTKNVRRWLNRLGEERMRQLLEVRRADIAGQPPDHRGERLGALTRVEQDMDMVLDQGQCFMLRDLAVNGRDLIHAGIPKGVMVGRVLSHLMDRVMEEEIMNERPALLDEAVRFYHQEEIPPSLS